MLTYFTHNITTITFLSCKINFQRCPKWNKIIIWIMIQTGKKFNITVFFKGSSRAPNVWHTPAVRWQYNKMWVLQFLNLTALSSISVKSNITIYILEIKNCIKVYKMLWKVFNLISSLIQFDVESRTLKWSLIFLKRIQILILIYI